MTVSKAADYATLVVYGVVFAFYLRRYIRLRKIPSLFINGWGLGWVLLACMDLGWFTFRPDAVFRWLGVLIGAALFASALRLELREKAEEKSRKSGDAPVTKDVAQAIAEVNRLRAIQDAHRRKRW